MVDAKVHKSTPPSRGAKLVLCSSSDMRHAREQVQTILDPLLSRLVTRQRISTVDWETCVAESLTEETFVMDNVRNGIPHEDIAGVVCLLGERIGLPLQSIDAYELSNLEQWSDSTRAQRLVFPWPDDKEAQLKLVGAGGFPLTGTVYQILSGLNSGTYIHISYLANKAITSNDTEVNLNGRHWRALILDRLDDNGEAARWLSEDYVIQTQSVINFINALNDQGLSPCLHQNLQHCFGAIRHFVETHIAEERLASDNPYRFLDFYDILDAADLPGRKEQSGTAVTEFIHRASQPGHGPMIAGITGESGCGKTSFMRAGMLAALAANTELGCFNVVAVRPTDFHDEQGQPDQQLPARLLRIIARDIMDLNITTPLLERVECAGRNAAKVAAEVLVECLERKSNEDTRKHFLVIGLDQFEEILDDLNVIDQRPYAISWRSLLAFVEVAANTGYFGFIYTLESARQEIFDLIDLPRVFRTAHEVPLGGYNDTFLQTIISQPFADAGYELSSRIVRELIKLYKQYDDATRSHASTLPLLALKLSNLFDIIQCTHGNKAQPSHRKTLHLRFEEQSGEISYEEIENDLSFDHEIEDLCHQAWGSSNESEEKQLGSLNSILQPLIALNDDTITLLTVSDSLVITTNEKLDKFEKLRLIIRENNRRRLVHEAVIRQWPLAKKWLKEKKDYLIRESKFRAEALSWKHSGEVKDDIPNDEDSIDIAVSVLRSYLHEWPFCKESDLTPSNQVLKSFCLLVFRHSTTPKRTSIGNLHVVKSHIHVAADYDEVELIKRFIDREPSSLDFPSGENRTPLDNAVWNSPNVTRILLDKGANAVNKDVDDWTTITAPIWQNDIDTFQLLLPYFKAEKNFQAPNDANLLHIASLRGCTEIMNILINDTSIEIDPAKEDSFGLTPIEYTVFQDRLDVFRLLLNHCDIRHISNCKQTILHHAAIHGAFRIAREIIRCQSFYDLIDAKDESGKTALMLAAMYRHDCTVNLLREAMDPNEAVPEGSSRHKGWTALHFAIDGLEKQETWYARQQCLRTVQALLSSDNIDPSIRGFDDMEPIMLVKTMPHVRSALMLHKNFVRNKLLSDGATPLNHLISSKDSQAVKRLLEYTDFDIEQLSKNGDYSLGLLLAYDMEDIALKLLEQDRVNPWDVEGANDIGLASAVHSNNLQLMDMFLKLCPQELTKPQQYHLTVAAKTTLFDNKKQSLFERLLAMGASPEIPIKGNDGTLFHYAALTGHLDQFNRLLQISSNCSARNKSGYTPLDLAPDHIQHELKERILKVNNDKKLENSKILFKVAQYGDVEALMEILSQPDITHDIYDDWGRTPADYAPDDKREQISKLLNNTSVKIVLE